MMSSSSRRGDPVSADPSTPSLPAWKAFVVQFTQRSGCVPKEFAGRVEHLGSGRREPFSSTSDLAEILQAMLREIEEGRMTSADTVDETKPGSSS